MIPKTAQYAVIFSSIRNGEDEEEYGRISQELEDLAATIDGYCGIQSVRGEDGFGITVSYWESEAAINEWRHTAKHLAAKKRAKTDWYDDYLSLITRIENYQRMPTRKKEQNDV